MTSTTTLTPDQNEILITLGARQTNDRFWLARCPCTANHKNGDRNPSLSIGLGDDGWLHPHCKTGCNRDEVRTALGYALQAWGPPSQGKAKRAPRPKSKIVKVYDYRDALGALKYQVCRCEPKNFLRRRFTPQGTVWGTHAGEYIENRPGHWVAATREAMARNPQARKMWFDGVPLLPYRLDQWLLTHEGTIYICEGEKDADAIAALGFESTSIPGGATPDEIDTIADECFRNRIVTIIPDNDRAGRERAQALLFALLSNGAGAVSLMRWDDGAPLGYDVSDYLASKTSGNLANYFFDFANSSVTYFGLKF